MTQLRNISVTAVARFVIVMVVVLMENPVIAAIKGTLKVACTQMESCKNVRRRYGIASGTKIHLNPRTDG